jgi:hypothetical protein
MASLNLPPPDDWSAEIFGRLVESIRGTRLVKFEQWDHDLRHVQQAWERFFQSGAFLQAYEAVRKGQLVIIHRKPRPSCSYSLTIIPSHEKKT